MDILRWSPKQRDAGLARLRAAMGEARVLQEADAGDVITIRGHWPTRVTVEAVELAGEPHRGRYFLWLTWTAPGARGREAYPAQTLVGIVSRAPVHSAHA